MGLMGLVFEILVLASCAAAVVMNIFFIQACDLIDLQNDDNFVGTLGLFEYQLPRVHDQCLTISDVENRAIEDKALKCARVCSLMALGFGAILFVFGFFKQCLFPLPCSQLLMDLSSSCVQLVLALVYVVWFSDYCRELYDCTYGHGSLYLVLCQIFWMIAGCFTRCMRPGRSERAKERDQD